MKTSFLILAAALLPAAAAADEVFLKGGGRLSGRGVILIARLVSLRVATGRGGDHHA
jgi:hypothetical protein